MHAFTTLDKKQHGTLEFPVEYYYVDKLHPLYQMPFHWHKEWELLRVLEGRLQIYLDDEPIVMGPGDIVLVRGETLHGGVPENCTYECLVFDLYGLFRRMDMVKPCLRPFYRQSAVPEYRFPAGSNPVLEEITDGLMSAFQRISEPGCRELETVAGLSKLFAWFIHNRAYRVVNTGEDGANRRIDRIKSVLEFIETSYKSSITLKDMAQIAGMNPNYFCRIFRSLTHQSPMDYVNFFRVEQAAHYLDSTDLSVTAVSVECGFWDSSYFTKVFKKYKGVTPREYRQTVVDTTG